MKDISKAFRGDPDVFEVTRPMKYLLGSFGIMLVLVPISLYVMLADVSDLMFVTFFYILVADLVLMVLTDVLVVLIWCPMCYPRDQKRDKKSNPGCAVQCLHTQISSDSVGSVQTDMFKDISVVELSRRLRDLHVEDEQQGAEDKKESSPGDKPVEVHDSSKANDPNLNDLNGDSSKHAPKQRFVPMRAHQQRVLLNPQRIENLTYGVPSGEYGPNQTHQSDTFSRHFSVPAPSQRGFWYPKKHLYLKADRSVGDSSKGKENHALGCFGDAARSRACELNCASMDQSGISHGHDSVPVPSQDDGLTGHVQRQKNPNSSSHQVMTESKQNSTSRYASGVDQSNAFSQQLMTELKQNSTSRYASGVNQPDTSSSKQTMTELKQNTTSRYASGVDQSNASSSKQALTELKQKNSSRYASGVDQSNASSSQQLMTELKQDIPSRYACGVDQSTACERTGASQDQNGTSSGHVSQQKDGLRHARHRKRFWTDPQPCITRDPTKREADKVNHLSSKSLDEVIKNMKKEREKPFQAKPAVRGFVKLKRSHNPPSYTESVLERRRFGASNIDDALELLPLSDDNSKRSSTAAWVYDDKNEVPPIPDSSPSLRRSRSAPSNRRHKLVSSSTRSSDSSARLPIPACADDSRHRVLHRLLATILTTGDDVIAAYPELGNIDGEQDVPNMEVEALPSGDYVMHMSMRMTSKELQNFRSRRDNNFKDSEFKKYLATLC